MSESWTIGWFSLCRTQSAAAARAFHRAVVCLVVCVAGVSPNLARAQVSVMPVDRGGGRIIMVPTYQAPYGNMGGVGTWQGPGPYDPSGWGRPPGGVGPEGNQVMPFTPGSQRSSDGVQGRVDSSVGAAGEVRPTEGRARPDTLSPSRSESSASGPRGAPEARERIGGGAPGSGGRALIALGDEFTGASSVNRDGTLTVGRTKVVLDAAVILPALELCGDGVQMHRCGTVSVELASSILSRMPQLRCLATAPQSSESAAVTAWCKAGREDPGSVLVKAGAARAADVRLLPEQMEAQEDRRGIWARSAGRVVQ